MRVAKVIALFELRVFVQKFSQRIFKLHFFLPRIYHIAKQRKRMIEMGWKLLIAIDESAYNTFMSLFIVCIKYYYVLF